MVKRTETIDTFYGQCKLHQSDRVSDLRCALRIHQDFIGSTPTLKHAEGKLVNLPHGGVAFAMMDKNPLELVLEDGRRAKIILKDLQGHFLVTGPIEQAQMT